MTHYGDSHLRTQGFESSSVMWVVNLVWLDLYVTTTCAAMTTMCFEPFEPYELT